MHTMAHGRSVVKGLNSFRTFRLGFIHTVPRETSQRGMSCEDKGLDQLMETMSYCMLPLHATVLCVRPCNNNPMKLLPAKSATLIVPICSSCHRGPVPFQLHAYTEAQTNTDLNRLWSDQLFVANKTFARAGLIKISSLYVPSTVFSFILPRLLLLPLQDSESKA
jgi:hypothetical protein